MAGYEGQSLKPPDATAAPGDDRQDEALEDQAARLPVDLLVDVLRRVPPRWLAASRCVCKAWRDAVDGRRLLRANLLPLSLAGLFVHYDKHKFPEFLARPYYSAPGNHAVSGDLSFLPSADGRPHCGYYYADDGEWEDYNIEDHCNGLLLLYNNCVVNPATRRWNTLPTCPAKLGVGRLVYDPTVSPYYQVYNIPILNVYRSAEDADPEDSEWPPSLCMYVFSSESGHWEEKGFVREGDPWDPARKVGKVRASGYSSAYLRGTLYVHHKTDSLVRLSLSNNTYSVIKSPVGLKVEDHPENVIARSEKGLYFVELDSRWDKHKCWLRVWILNESGDQMEWILKHDKDLRNMLPQQWFCRRVKWILEDINYNLFHASSFRKDIKKRRTTEEKFEWNFDEDVEEKDMVDHGYLEDKKTMVVDDVELLGFHPYKEIIFLSKSQEICLAYHLNGSKIEKLGNIYPKRYRRFHTLVNDGVTITSFPYTPCWID